MAPSFGLEHRAAACASLRFLPAPTTAMSFFSQYLMLSSRPLSPMSPAWLLAIVTTLMPLLAIAGARSGLPLMTTSFQPCGSPPVVSGLSRFTKPKSLFSNDGAMLLKRPLPMLATTPLTPKPPMTSPPPVTEMVGATVGVGLGDGVGECLGGRRGGWCRRDAAVLRPGRPARRRGVARRRTVPTRPRRRRRRRGHEEADDDEQRRRPPPRRLRRRPPRRGAARRSPPAGRRAAGPPPRSGASPAR